MYGFASNILVMILRRLIVVAVGEPVGRNVNWSVSVIVGGGARRLDKGTAERLSAP